MCEKFEKVQIKHLPKYLSHLKQLQSLELNFDRPNDLGDSTLINLASVLPKLPLLTQINLSLARYGRMILGSTLLEIFSNIRNCSSINLNFEDFNVVNQEASDFLVEGLKQLQAPLVQTLRLHVHKNLSPQDFISVCQTFTRFTSLNLLHLSFLESKSLTKHSVVELCLVLSRITTLSSLSLKIPFAAKSISVIGSLASAIKSLPNLVHFKLSFESDMESHPDEIPQLFESLKTLTHLQFLDVSFANQKSLSDDILERFSESLQKLVQLKHLTLGFGDASPMTAQGVEFLTNAIAKMSDLSFLDLNFGGIREIDEETIERIAQTIRHLPLLYSVNLRFIKCFRLRDNERSLLSLFDALKEMENIREVFLYISKGKMNEREVDDLQKRKTVATYWC